MCLCVVHPLFIGRLTLNVSCLFVVRHEWECQRESRHQAQDPGGGEGRGGNQ